MEQLPAQAKLQNIDELPPPSAEPEDPEDPNDANQ
jgi:hypothetical protein